jgi:predicted ATPase with chaperone activity
MGRALIVELDSPEATAPEDGPRVAPPPPSPADHLATGLSEVAIGELVLKHLFVQGVCAGFEVARRICLPFSVLEPILQWLKDQKLLEVMGGDILGPISYRYALTEQGRLRAREAMSVCQYVGPAPVTLEQYFQQMQRQAVRGVVCHRERLKTSTQHLVLPDDLLDALGPAVVSGHSMLLYGPPGSGKSAVSRALGEFLNREGGLIWVPYALYAEDSIITLYDPLVHRRIEDELLHVDWESFVLTQHGVEPDRRWVSVRRPIVVAGGELTLEMLDLSFNTTGNFYQPPMQLKANGGVLVIDDFGRQIVSPRHLLNRWILPLEERVDYLTLANGKKLKIPFELLVIFSTNLDPRELADEAFLRRIRYKIEFRPPDRAQFEAIFQTVCSRLELAYRPEAVDRLFEKYYVGERRPRGSDPRDLLEIVVAICRYRNEEPRVDTELIDEAAERFFGLDLS